jgi:hypothetical protein
VVLERALDVAGETGIARAESLQKRRALVRIELERAVELRTDGEPALGAQARHPTASRTAP